MPQRSNSFQRLILLVEASLNPLGARVIESLMLRDLTTGDAREIDVAIEIPTGPRTIRIALEVRDQRRPASVQWVDEIAGKYIHLPVDRIVAVSHSGFTTSARDKAASFNIDLLMPEEIPEFDWKILSSVKRFVSTATVSYQWEIIALDPTCTALSAPPSDPIESLLLHDPSGETQELGNLIHAFIDKAESRASMAKMWNDRPGAELQFQLELVGWSYRDLKGNEHALKHADVALTGQVDWLNIELRTVTYAGETVAHGETTLDGQPVSLVVIEQEDQEPQWLWYVKNTDKQLPWRLSSPPTFVQGQKRLVSVFHRQPTGLDRVTWRTDAMDLWKSDAK